jgi:hypothetical protein
VTHAEALQYLASVANDFLRTLPASAQGPTSVALNEAVQTLAAQGPATDMAAMVNGDASAVETAPKKDPAREPVRG